jgi:hypothetical protein
VVSTARPTISVQFDEAIDVATWSKLGLIVQSPSGGIVPGDYTYYPSIATGTFTPSADLAIGSTYIVTVGDVRDLAGNRVRDSASWTIRRLLATSVSLAAKPTVVVSGGSVSLSLTADLPTGEPVILESKPGGVADFVTQQSILPIDGHYVRTFVPQSNLTFRATYPGSATSAASNSAEVRILVRRKVWMAGPGPATTRRSVTGTSLTLAAQVAPAGVASVSFRLYRYDARIGGYRYAGSLGRRTDASGRATINWDAPAGRFYWRVAVLSSPTFANNMTLPYRFDIRR